MENLTSVKVTVCTVFGAIGAFIANLFGGWSNDMTTLLIFMAADYVTGIIVAAFFKKSNKSKTGSLSSIAGLKGLAKKGVILLVVLIAYRLDMSLGISYIKTTTIIGFIANELVSIIENVGLMGIPLPGIITKAIEILHDKGKEEESNADK